MSSAQDEKATSATSECLRPHCAALLLEWLRAEAGITPSPSAAPGSPVASEPIQGELFRTRAYNDEAPRIRSLGELEDAFEHLEYAVYRRFENQLTRAERSRMDNTIRNALYKIRRFGERWEGPEKEEIERRRRMIERFVVESEEKLERLRRQAQRADLKIAQLSNLTPEAFEEFVGEVFEALGFAVETVGGTGDQGVDLLLTRKGLRAAVQCKYHKKGVVGSPEIQKFLGAIQHSQCHKGYFVTTKTFSVAAERFASEHPIELIDGPSLIDLLREAMGPKTSKAKPQEATLFL